MNKQMILIALVALIMTAQCFNLIPAAGQAQAQSLIYILLAMIDPRPQDKKTIESPKEEIAK